MKNLRALTGLPVVCHGRRVGRMLQAALSDDLKALQGIWVSAGPGGARWIPAEALQMLGRVAILADEPGEKGRAAPCPLFRRATATDGTRLGAVTGAEIDEISFAVTALELSRGFWDDLGRGRQRVRAYTVNRETGEVLVDPAGQARGEDFDERRHDQGTDRGDAARFGGGDGVRRDELADRAQVEPAGEEDRQLDL